MSVTVKYFNEYLYYKAVMSVNERITRDNGEPLTTTEAKALRSKLDAAISGMTVNGKRYDMATSGASVMIASLDSVFADYVPSVFTTEQYNEYVREFSAYAGISSSNTKTTRTQRYDTAYIPISPFDPTYADREAFMRGGTQMYFAKASEVMPDKNGEINVPHDQIKLYREGGNEMKETKQYLMSDADKSGVALLAPYMTEAEYDDVSEWMISVGKDDDTRYMSQAAAQRSAGLLRLMKENGLSYKVVRDENPGQIVARIDGTRINVRLADTRQNENYIGRVYDNGHTYRYITDKQSGTNNYQTGIYTPRTAGECYDLLRYAMGESVPRWDTRTPVGEVRTEVLPSYRWSNRHRVPAAPVERNASYHTNQNASYVISRMPNDNEHSIFLHVDNSRGQSERFFPNAELSDAYLTEAVETARQNFKNEIDIEDIIREAEAHRGDADYVYDYNGDETIAAIQRSYWSILTSDEELDVYRPGVKLDEYMDNLGDEESISINDIPTYTGTPAEKIRQHFNDNVDYMIGSFEPDAEGKRFDPVNVAKYMTSEYNVASNNRNVVSALRKSGIVADELKGSNFYNNTVKDRLIRFDKNTAVPMYMNSDPFVQSMYNTILTTIRESGCTVDEAKILMDENGIVQYEAERVTSRSLTDKAGNSTRKPITGEIGQIFVPDGYGMVETKFAGSNNYLFVPGYEASVVTGPDTADQTLEERTRLRGYEQIMRENIAHTLRGDLLANRDFVGEPTSVNNTYRQIYDERHPLDWVEQSTREGMDEDLRRAIVMTEARRVKYPKEFRDSSTVNADYTANLDNNGQMVNDNFYSSYRATGERNIAIMSAEGDGYFDPVMTSAGIEQGVTRYLTEGAVVGIDGKIIPSADKSDMAPLMKHDIMKFTDYDAWDRRQMTAANLIKASCVTAPVKTALTTLDGWNMDDAFVVSRDFAQQYQITTPDGVIRPLKIGDKISDPHGNKGVISLVVDPDMDAEEAKEKGISDVVALFKNNEGLAVVGAPFSGVSRFNGGTAREMQSGEVEKLVGPNGEDLGQAMGTMSFIVTHLSVDKKSSLYGPDAESGKGRKAGAQLGMALSAANVPGIMREFYGDNVGPLRNMREVCIAMGGDMSETGELLSSYEAHEGEKRKVFAMPEPRYVTRKTKTGETSILDMSAMKREFGAAISRQGGFMELPFPLNYPNGKQLDKLTEDENVTVNYKKLEWPVTRKRKDGTEITYMAHRHDDANTERSTLKHKATYALPVISAHMRSEQDFEDGTTHLHDYTNSYLKIYEAAARYIEAERENNKADMAKYMRTAQSEYSKITGSLEARFIDAKKNMVRDGVMSNTRETSATAVWTPDPRIGLDEIGIGREFADGLGLKDGDKVLIWRDPILRESGLCYVTARVNDELTGISSNPVTAPRYEGDYDGDTIAVVPLRTKAARRDAEEKFSMAATLLDKGYKREDGTFDFNLQGGLDIAAAHYKNPELAARREALRIRANEVDASDMLDYEKLDENKKILAELNDYVHDCFTGDVGSETLRVGDAQQVMESMGEMVDHGTKGSMGKLAKYAKFYGVDIKKDAAGNLDLTTVEDRGKTLVDRTAAYDAQYCTAVKAHGTGTAGRYQHRGIEAFRNTCPRAVLELTRPVTQSLLQLKHEDKDTAYRKYSMLMSTARDLWRGYELEKFDRPDGTAGWKKVTDSKGKPVQATRDKWVEQFKEVYHSKDGLDTPINPDFVEQVADVMAEHGKDGRVMNIEECTTSKAFMDRMAYSGSLDTLYEGMKNQANIFYEDQNRLYAPTVVMDNREALAEGEQLKAVVAKDVRDEYKPKTSVKATMAAPVVKSPTTKPSSKSALSYQDIPNGGSSSPSAELPNGSPSDGDMGDE